jgi:hypothetical protein
MFALYVHLGLTTTEFLIKYKYGLITTCELVQRYLHGQMYKGDLTNVTTKL